MGIVCCGASTPPAADADGPPPRVVVPRLRGIPSPRPPPPCSDSARRLVSPRRWGGERESATSVASDEMCSCISEFPLMDDEGVCGGALATARSPRGAARAAGAAEVSAAAAVRALLPPHTTLLLRQREDLQQWLTDHRVVCFLRQHNSQEEAAAAALAASLEWRAEARPDAPCPLCLHNPAAHCFRQIGFDISGRCLAYQVFSQANMRSNIAANVAHMLWLFEQESAWERSGGTPGLVMMVDFHGYSMLTDGNPASSIALARVMHNYPGMLYRSIMIDAGLFGFVWRLVRPLLPAAISEAIVFMSREEAVDEIRTTCSESTAAWLEREMEDNRRRLPGTGPGEKAYWRAPACRGEHDGRGAPDLLVHPGYRPVPYPADDGPPNDAGDAASATRA